MIFDIGMIEYEGAWGGDSHKKEFDTLEELCAFINAAEGYVYRFIVYDGKAKKEQGVDGYITFCEMVED